jgi:hypothetical protein
VIYQGNRYAYRDQSVIALQSHPTGFGSVRCIRLDPGHPAGLGPVFWARAEGLKPEPMKYFHGGTQ